MPQQDPDSGLQLFSTVRKDGTLELSLAEVPRPEPRDDQVVIRVEAAPINPSDLGLIGRYVFTPDVFEVLENLPTGVGGEVQLTDAIAELGEIGRCLGYVAEQDLLDVGTPLGLLEASTVLGVSHPDWGTEYQAYLAGLMEEL